MHCLPVSRHLLKSVQQLFINRELVIPQLESLKPAKPLDFRITHAFYRNIELTWKC